MSLSIDVIPGRFLFGRCDDSIDQGTGSKPAGHPGESNTLGAPMRVRTSFAVSPWQADDGSAQAP